MKRNRKSSRGQQQTIQVWTYEQACRVLPYVASIMRSLRDQWLEAQRHHVQVRRLAQHRGRPGRDNLIAHEEAVTSARRADEHVQEALEELHTLDIYCLDPVRGLALIPFAQNDKLAWFVYDLFDTKPLRFWRYHRDSLETRRPIAEALEGPSQNSSIVI